MSFNTLDGLSMLDTAMTLACEWGFSVIPVRTGTKRPAVESWTQYQTVPADEEQIEEWWTKWPNANIAIVCGEVSGLIAADADAPEAVKWLEDRMGLSPVKVLSGREGHCHYYYRWSAAAQRFIDENWNRLHSEVHLDLQGNGRYVIAPNSIHENGNRYRLEEERAGVWTDGYAPEFNIGAEINLDTSEGAVREGGRNVSLASYAGRLLSEDHYLGWEPYWQELCRWNRDSCRPMLRRGELLTTAISIFKTDFKNHVIPEKAERTPASTELRKLDTLAEYMAAEDEDDYICSNLVPAKGVGTVFGARSSGKSFLVLDLALRIARGEPFMGLKTEKRPVVFWIGEGRYKKRLQAWMKKFGPLPENVLVDWREGLALRSEAEAVRFSKTVPEGALVVIDTLNTATAGVDENSGKDMQPVLLNCKAVADARNACVLLVAHTGKDESRGVRGWSGIEANVDFSIKVSGGPATDDTRRFNADKEKESAIASGDGTPFHLEVVKLEGVNNLGEPRSSCVISPGESPVDGDDCSKDDRPLNKGEKRFLYSFMMKAVAAGLPVTKTAIRDGLESLMATKSKRYIYSEMSKSIRTLTEAHVIESADGGTFTIPETINNRRVLDSLSEGRSAESIMKLFESVKVSKTAVFETPEEF